MPNKLYDCRIHYGKFKKIGKADWIGAKNGGEGFFCGYCKECGAHFYFNQKRLAAFLKEVDWRPEEPFSQRILRKVPKIKIYF